MAVKMVIFCVTLVLSIIGSNANGELRILHHPDSVSFTGASELRESVLKDVFSASVGLSVEENSDWNGLQILDPFRTSEALVEIYIDGVSSLGSVPKDVKKYPLIVDEYEPDTYRNVKHRIQQRFSSGDNKLVNINLSDPNELISYANVFGDIKVPKVTKRTLQHLKYSVEEDYQFLSELEALNAITAKVKSGVIKPDNAVDYYNFRFRSLHALSDYHGPSSLQTKEAKTLLNEALQELSAAFAKAYDNSVVVAAVSTDVAHTRRVRAAKQMTDETRQQMRNDDYSSEYAAIFNIILWFGIVFAFTLVAIVYALIDMDPGRDSIIYRMTSTRMKKDN